MGAPEDSGPTTERPEHSMLVDAEGRNLKYNFMEMIESLKEEMKSSLREMEEKANKKVERNQ